jgi:hypothetical protein
LICRERWEWCGCSAARGKTDAVTMGILFLHSFWFFILVCLILELVWLLKDWFFILIINLLIQIETGIFKRSPIFEIGFNPRTWMRGCCVEEDERVNWLTEESKELIIE